MASLSTVFSKVKSPSFLIVKSPISLWISRISFFDRVIWPPIRRSLVSVSPSLFSNTGFIVSFKNVPMVLPLFLASMEKFWYSWGSNPRINTDLVLDKHLFPLHRISSIT